MCGIVGFAAAKAFLDRSTLSRMCETLVHRGPDDSGCEVWDAKGNRSIDGPGCVGLAQRRLSILDLSSAGRQPMCTEDKKFWVSYNGEFYNHLHFRSDLAKRHSFRSESDTETLLYLFKEQGIEKTLQSMNGMFAFGLWDTQAETLFLARDRLGKKPLYYSQLADGSLIFASEIKALLASGCIDEAQIDETALAQFWLYGYSMGEQTIYKQIKRLLPGHFAKWKNNRLSLHEYWDCSFGLEVTEGETLDGRADQLEELLCNAITDRLLSDVPLGLFLSGGIDSALLAALMKRKLNVDVETYTIGFKESGYDESGQAAAIAAKLGLRNHILPLQGVTTDDWGSIAKQFDEPFGDSSAIPTYFVSKLAKKYVTVVLTGDGGDELFGGYSLYRKALSWWGTAQQRSVFSSSARSIMEVLSDTWFRYGLSSRKLKVFDLMLAPKKLSTLLSASVMKQVDLNQVASCRNVYEERIRNSDVLSQLQYMNLKTYLVDDVLVKVDRMSMAHGLECRCPLLDYRVAEFAGRQPLDSKISRQGEQKALLRHLLRRYLPNEFVTIGKRGFSTPWEHWCNGPFEQNMLRKWESQKNGYMSASGAKFIFDPNSGMEKTLKWNAFSALCFFEERS